MLQQNQIPPQLAPTIQQRYPSSPITRPVYPVTTFHHSKHSKTFKHFKF